MEDKNEPLFDERKPLEEISQDLKKFKEEEIEKQNNNQNNNTDDSDDFTEPPEHTLDTPTYNDDLEI